MRRAHPVGDQTTIKAYDVTVNVTISIGLAIYRRTGRKRPS